ncbi:MAG: CRISPR-associated endonuclease Cas2 [Pseudomonadota bacterium]
MYWVIAYDIADPRRLRRVAALLADHGQRVQESVFECELDAVALLGLRRRLLDEIEPGSDSIRYYPLCRHCLRGASALGPEGAPQAPGYYLD